MRRILATPLMLILIAVPAYGQESDAEKLFRAMEKKIRSAKSLKIVSATEAEFGGMPGKLNATGQLAEGNKSLIEMEYNFGGNSMKLVSVCDGKQVLKQRPAPLPATAPEAAPPNRNEVLIAGFARAGLAAGINILEKQQFGDIDKSMPVSEFKLGAKERVGTAEAQIVEYVLAFGGTDKTSMKVWIDTKTMLPLKRHIQSDDKLKGQMTETYTEFVLDPKLDAKVFELPK